MIMLIFTDGIWLLIHAIMSKRNNITLMFKYNTNIGNGYSNNSDTTMVSWETKNILLLRERWQTRAVRLARNTLPGMVWNQNIQDIITWAVNSFRYSPIH